MEQELLAYLDALQARLRLLAELAQALRSSWPAFTSLDLPAIHSHLAEQQRLCRLLAELDQQTISPARRAAARDFSPELPHLEIQLRQACAELDQLSAVHAAMLKRSRRTLDALQRWMQSAAPTYSPLQRPLPQAGAFSVRS